MQTVAAAASSGGLCTKNTSRALIERPYSCAPQAVGAVYDRPGFFVQSPSDGTMEQSPTYNFQHVYFGDGPGLANFALSIGTFGRTSFNLTVSRPSSQRTFQRNGILTPAISR